MIEFPDFDKAFEYENNYYLSCRNNRISKILAQYEIYKMVVDLPGDIVECGVFKGVSLTRWAAFRDMLNVSFSKKIIGFDVFGKFPDAGFSQDEKKREGFIDKAGDESISKEQMMAVLKNKGVDEKVVLIEGDIVKTVPSFLVENPELKISMLNLDTDIYEPAVVILEHLYPRIVPGGVLILDNYGVFPGETRAVDEYFKDQEIKIRKIPFSMTPCYMIKE